jgi:hypothetical protein
MVAPTRIDDRTDKDRWSHRQGSMIAPTRIDDRADKDHRSHRRAKQSSFVSAIADAES